jgi:hemin uptake protein HemP
MNAPFAQPRPRPTHAPAPDRRGQRTNERPEHDARTLTEGGAEARIVLDGMTYVLRITRLGKLILTK